MSRTLPLLLLVACTQPLPPAVLDSGEPAVEDAGTPDAGGEPDAGAEVDAGSHFDAGAPEDSGVPDAGMVEPMDSGVEDAGVVEVPDAGAPDAGIQVPFAIEGFGRATRGGWQPGGDELVVTSLSDSGPGTLREALATATGPRVIRFGVDGAIALASALLVPSNVSIDGRGRQVTLSGKGLILAGSDDVIITNLAIGDVGPNSEDGLRIGDPTGPSERVVIDHVRFFATGNNGDSANVDEAIAVVFGSRDITLSWLRFDGWEKVLLVGNGDAPASVDGAITLSMHHCWAKNTGRRHPQARYGIVDLWNVFLDDWRMYDWFYLQPYRESFGAQSQDGARLRVEASLFKRTPQTKDAFSQANDATRCESGGRLDGIANVTTSDSTAPLVFGAGCTSGATMWVRPYPATVDAADAALRLRLETQTGNTL